MKLDRILDVWGNGQLLTFSGLEGETDWKEGLLLRTVEPIAAMEIKLPMEQGRLLLGQGGAVESCFLACDAFCVNGVTGVMVDAHHLLLEGEVREEELPEALLLERRGNRALLGVRRFFNPQHWEADLPALLLKRRNYFASLPDYSQGNDDARRTLAKAYSQLKGQIYSACDEIGHLWSTPDRWPHRWMWLWDSVFHAIGLRHFNPEAAREILAAVLSQQLPDGLIPHMMQPDGHSMITQPPVLAFGIGKVQEVLPDDEFLAEAFPRLERYLEWIMRHRDSDGAGLVEWNIEGNPMCRSGESGMDNSPRFDSATQLDAPDFNSYLSMECEVMAGFARRLGLEESEVRWQSEHDRINRLMNERLWCEAERIYMDFDLQAQALTGISSSAGFLPLFCGAPSIEQAFSMSANLRDPETFGTPLRIPSISRRNVAAYSKDMWRGPVWTNINYLTALGLLRYGMKQQARDLITQTLREQERCYLRFGTFFEFYDDRREIEPPALLRKGCCAPEKSPYHQVFHDYGWSATLYIEMLWLLQNLQ